MYRTAIFAMASAGVAAALLSTPASAGGYYAGGYAPYPYGGYPQPYVPPPAPYYSGGYAPAPYVVAPAPPPRLPAAPVINWPEGARYYSGYSNGFTNVATPCYVQRVRVPDGYGGWVWGLKSSCDTH